jgi:hypothetical protein
MKLFYIKNIIFFLFIVTFLEKEKIFPSVNGNPLITCVLVIFCDCTAPSNRNGFPLCTCHNNYLFLDEECKKCDYKCNGC